ncbi:hypothetical protein BLNAU_8236 [Blattamonas nauphoetae]|uniref:Uncharacterized protein n=1 Tax=Blattamonas nauphoetae TaxID=2049346 RepID=A0ABQ9XUG4_9EUKA|nr:hypothetical protein BLNAU_20872 [Blattamonas nauphoetae]KAK2944781.1 hypothetical protein BLNAU_20314 [Blattamonas nauphoetae]KAK2953387.1 hypothetical protein BLNAU_11673 [Blattamonas nauphoetae]KAK2955127.1 hypothetical protein BLNAU_9856 [Blattamonas nauphoetae]KAK2956783.1 hypothetical protein BLNAU_8236 [Blattamonas nauphoetae]
MSERKLWSYAIPPEITKRTIGVPTSIEATFGIAAGATRWNSELMNGVKRFPVTAGMDRGNAVNEIA